MRDERRGVRSVIAWGGVEYFWRERRVKSECRVAAPWP